MKTMTWLSGNSFNIYGGGTSIVDKRPESSTYNQIEVVDVKPGTCVDKANILNSFTKVL